MISALTQKKPRTEKKYKNIIVLIFSLLLILSPFSLFFSRVDYLLTISLLLVGGVLAAALPSHISKNNTLSIAVLVFFALFFVLAPVIQLNNSPTRLVNTMLMNTEAAVTANLYTLVFIFLFLGFEKYFSSKKLEIKYNSVPTDINLGALVLLAALSIVVSAFALNDLRNMFSQTVVDALLSEQLLKSKVAYMVPFVALALLLQTKHRKNILLIAVLLICVLLTKNPLMEKRNAIGPAYLALLVMAFPKIISSGKNFFYLIIFVMLVAFPASSVFTHSTSKLETKTDISVFIDAITNHFLQLHYDAWANFVTTIQMVSEQGHTWGYQLIGTLFFFIPRSLWADKPDMTGFLIGDYLSAHYSMWFNNLSSPIVAEGYIDFGIIGIALMSVALAFIVAKLHRLYLSGRHQYVIFYAYFSFSMFFVLRGALMTSFAYIAGAYLAIHLVSLISRKLNFRLGPRPRTNPTSSA